MKNKFNLFFAIFMSILFIFDCWQLTIMEITHWYDILIAVFSLLIACLSWVDVFREDE